MFGLGFFESAIVLGLGYLAFRHIIARRWPGVIRALNFALAAAAVLMLLFGLLARTHR